MIIRLCLFSIALVLAACCFREALGAETIFPGKSWVEKSPADVGWNDGKLSEFARRVGGDGVIIQGGYLVKSWGQAAAHKDWASAAKPVLSTLLLLAVHEGKLPSVDAPVETAGWELLEKDRSMTFRHLANMVSGYACAEPPGAAWGYNDYAIQLYARSLEKVWGEKLDEVIRRQLAALQFEDGAIFGSRRGAGVLASPRDFARLGWLWLNRGQWQGQSLLPEKLFVDCLRPGVPASLPRTKQKGTDYLGIGTYGGGTDQTPHGPGVYGFNFWFNQDLEISGEKTRIWPALPEDTYQANGMWNRDTVTMFPSLQMVVAVRGAKLGAFEPGRKEGEAHRNLTLLVEARTQAKAGRSARGTYFPPPGESPEQQARASPAEVGLDDSLIRGLEPHVSGRWAVWRDGYLIHVHGDWNQKQDVASLRKTWHAMAVGAALKQGRIPGLDQPISKWVSGLQGEHASATWWHVITQTSGFDYPYGEFPAYKPGEIWTYSDKNPRVLCDALARVYGKEDFRDQYRDVLQSAYFDAIGMRGWEAISNQDGVRLKLDLEDMGRLGLLALNRGKWNGAELIPQSFVEQLERKQTDTIRVNYNGPDDGNIGLDSEMFPEVPYGYMTWSNTDGDFYPGADRAWAWGQGAGGTRIMWNRNLGLVFAGVGVANTPSRSGIAHVLERAVRGPNPMLSSANRVTEPMPPVSPVVTTSMRPPNKQLGHIGSFAKWRRVELVLTGFHAQSRGEPNPFGVAVDGILTAPGGKRWKVPGFYDGDGKGGPDGTIWKVRFSADEPGEWVFESHSSEPTLDGWTANFTVTAIPPDATGIYRWGKLEAVGTAENQVRYLKFRDGPYWLKAGCDDPENFLGNYSHYNSTDKRIAAIDYLASRGINSLYIMTHNLDGDDKDVWPWLGKTQQEAKAHSARDIRFDIPRLQEWLTVFEQMQVRGMVTYLVLEDDNAWKDYDHARYYRELIARFGHLPGLLFNLNEEFNENYQLPEALGLMQQLKALDPYDTPRGIHNVNLPDDSYVDALQIDFTAIQTGSPGRKAGGGLEHNRLVNDWINRCRDRKQRILMVGVDEGRPEEDRASWWSAYLAGGVWEAHLFPPYDRPMSAWETVWKQLGGTRQFMESLPFWKMNPSNDVVRAGKAFCLAKPGEIYALYLPDGGPVEIDLPNGSSFQLGWWNPVNGPDGRFEGNQTVSGGRQRISPPGPGDWAARLTRTPATTNVSD